MLFIFHFHETAWKPLIDLLWYNPLSNAMRSWKIQIIGKLVKQKIWRKNERVHEWVVERVTEWERESEESEGKTKLYYVLSECLSRIYT